MARSIRDVLGNFVFKASFDKANRTSGDGFGHGGGTPMPPPQDLVSADDLVSSDGRLRVL